MNEKIENNNCILSPFVCVKGLVDALHLEVIAGEEYLMREIKRTVVSRPGVEIYANYFKFYEKDRLQIIGSKESQIFLMLNHEEKRKRIKELFSPVTPAFVFTKHVEVVPEEFIEGAQEFQIPLLKINQTTTIAISSISTYLEEALAERKSIHGVMIDIKGVGVLITGKSSVGKSEAALELLMRGHTLVADDHVEMMQVDNGMVFGFAPELTERLMEVRGLGLIDVVDLFGVKAYRKRKRLMLVVELVKWEEQTNYDRLGLSEEFIKILDTNIPKITIPVQPGRNLATLIEVAALNWRLKSFGRNVAKEFVEKLDTIVKGDK